MRFIAVITAILCLLIAGCSGTATEAPPPEPLALLTEAAANIRAADTLRLQVERTGADYLIDTDFGRVEFVRATAQYVAPNQMQATVRVIAEILTIDVDIFSKGEDQWFKGIWTNNIWSRAVFAPGFNPEKLISQESGFQAALGALIDLEMVGSTELDDGTPVYHMKATANGADVSALMMGLIYAEGEVLVDVYVSREERYPVRFVIVQPNTVTDNQPDPTTWTVDVYDINAEAVLDDPEAAAPATPTAESGS